MAYPSTDRVALYHRVSKDAVPEHGYKKLPREEKLFSKPTLLTCGGIYSNMEARDGERSANGFAKLGHALLGVKDHLTGHEPYEIVSVVYPEHEGYLATMLEGYNADQQSGTGMHVPYSKFAKNFAHDHLLPLVSHRGHRLPIEEVCHNLRNINVVTHSYGAAFFQQVGNALVQEMQMLDYTAAEIRQATSQVLVVNAGSVAVLGGGKANFTMVDLVNYSDTEMPKHYVCGRDVRDLVNDALKATSRLHHEEKYLPQPNVPAFMQHTMPKPKPYYSVTLPARPLNILPIRLEIEEEKPYLRHDPGGNHLLVYASQPLIRNGLGDIIMREGIRPMRRSESDGNFSDDTLWEKSDTTGHQAQTYFHYGLGTHGLMLRTVISSALANGLYNSIDNHKEGRHFKPLAPVAELIHAPEKVRYHNEKIPDFTKLAAGIGYNDRIDEALAGPEQKGRQR